MVRKILAGIFVFLFVVVALPIVTVYGIYRTFILEDSYKEELLDVVYEMWIDTVPDDVKWEDEFGNIDREGFIEILRDTFAPEDLATVAESLETQIDEAKFSEGKFITIEIPFEWMRGKAEMLSESMAELIAGGLEQCESDEEFEVLEHNCIPEGILISTVKEGLRLDLERQILNDIPELYEIDIELPVDAKTGDDVSDYFNMAISNFFVVGTLLLAVLMIIISLIIYKPLSSIIKWDFKAIFIASLVPLIMFILVYNFAGKMQWGDSEATFDLIVLLVKSLSRNIISFLIPIAAVSLLLMLIGGFYEKKHGSSKTL